MLQLVRELRVRRELAPHVFARVRLRLEPGGVLGFVVEWVVDVALLTVLELHRHDVEWPARLAVCGGIIGVEEACVDLLLRLVHSLGIRRVLRGDED